MRGSPLRTRGQAWGGAGPGRGGLPFNSRGVTVCEVCLTVRTPRSQPTAVPLPRLPTPRRPSTTSGLRLSGPSVTPAGFRLDTARRRPPLPVVGPRGRVVADQRRGRGRAPHAPAPAAEGQRAAAPRQHPRLRVRGPRGAQGSRRKPGERPRRPVGPEGLGHAPVGTPPRGDRVRQGLDGSEAPVREAAVAPLASGRTRHCVAPLPQHAGGQESVPSYATPETRRLRPSSGRPGSGRGGPYPLRHSRRPSEGGSGSLLGPPGVGGPHYETSSGGCTRVNPQVFLDLSSANVTGRGFLQGLRFQPPSSRPPWGRTLFPHRSGLPRFPPRPPVTTGLDPGLSKTFPSQWLCRDVRSDTLGRRVQAQCEELSGEEASTCSSTSSRSSRIGQTGNGTGRTSRTCTSATTRTPTAGDAEGARQKGRPSGSASTGSRRSTTICAKLCCGGDDTVKNRRPDTMRDGSAEGYGPLTGGTGGSAGVSHDETGGTGQAVRTSPGRARGADRVSMPP